MADALHTPDVPIVRQLLAPPDIRVATDEEREAERAAGEDPSLGTLHGHFSVFNTWYRVESFWEGEFLERVAPGAFKQTFREDRDRIRILFDHGFDPVIGNKVLAPLRELKEDDEGGYYEGPLFDTTYNRDLLPGLRASVYGASFRMRVREELWSDEPEPSDDNPKGLPERTIRNAKVFEMGPVTFPANPDATAGMRSATDHYMELLARQDEVAFDVISRSVQALRPDFTGVPVSRRDGRGERKNEQRPGSGGGSVRSLLDDPEQRHMLLRARGVI